MADNITLDRGTFKALAVESRIQILKLLLERDMTATDIADAMDMSNSTISEHLSVMRETGLIEQEDTDRKWKYYSLTRKGERLVNPNKRHLQVGFLLGLGGLAFSAYKIFTKLTVTPTTTRQEGAQMMMEAAEAAAPPSPAFPTEWVVVGALFLALTTLMVLIMKKEVILNG